MKTKKPHSRGARIGRFLPGLLVGLAAGTSGCESKTDFRNSSREGSGHAGSRRILSPQARPAVAGIAA